MIIIQKKSVASWLCVKYKNGRKMMGDYYKKESHIEPRRKLEAVLKRKSNIILMAYLQFMYFSLSGGDSSYIGLGMVYAMT